MTRTALFAGQTRRIFGRSLSVWLGLVAPALGWSQAARSNVQQEKIVSLSPATTEWIFAFGRGKSLVGRTEACDRPSAASVAPSVGAFLEPNLGRILTLKPDLVVVTTDFNAKRVAELARQVPEVFRLDTSSFAVWIASVRKFARRLGAEHLAQADLKRSEESLKRVVSGAHEGYGQPLRFVGFVDAASGFVFSRASLQGSLFEAFGLVNLVTLEQGFPQVSDLFLMQQKPDVVVFFSNPEAKDGGESLAGPLVPTAREMRRVQELWPAAELVVVKLDGDVFLRPGPRLLSQGLPHLANRLAGIRRRLRGP